METPAQLIERKGGAAAFAAAIGAEPSAVRMMKHRQRLPRSAWPEIMKAFPDVSLDDLMAMEISPPGERDAHGEAAA